MRDSIGFGNVDISILFRRLLIPTVLGMVFSAMFVIIDGIFAGRGVGSDALIAVNITAPLFMITTGIGLTFGVRGSVVASIYLSQGRRKTANINVTQALVFSTFIVLVTSALCFCFVGPLGCLLGSSNRLLPLVIEYMIQHLPFLVFYELLSAGMFFIRLDGSPNYAMMCNAIAAMFSTILDCIFVFEFGWGMMGAVFATSPGTVVDGLMTIIYLTRFSRNIYLHRIKLSLKSLMLTLRNGGYMIELGTSAFVSEASIACMMFLGNYIFIHHLGGDGVAAFSIACCSFPIILMVYNAIAQSAQPIISCNFDAGQPDWVRKALRLAVHAALICGINFFIITFLCRQNIVSLFIDRSCPVFDIAVNGISYFRIGFIFFAANMINIGYYQDIRRGQRTTIITLLRGVVLMLIGFFVLPLVLRVPGVWLAISLVELLTTLYIIGIYFKDCFIVHRLWVYLQYGYIH